jgi:hypothetical protein
MNLRGATSPKLPGPQGRSPWSGLAQALAVLLLCVLSRAATTIRHIEDADSLRFALGVLDFDVTKLQPQFPGYAAFMGTVKLLHALLGSYALAFSVIGGLGAFVLIHYSLATLRWRFAEPRGAVLGVLLLFNPMVWLLGNRYMSDLSGAACMLAAFYHLARTDSRRHLLAGFFLTGLLAGWRLSYAPFLIPALAAALWALWRTEADAATSTTNRLRASVLMALAGAAGALIWLVPLIIDTGWQALIGTALGQTGAHFTATGGTYMTESSWPLRVLRILSHLWADGLGAWAPGRHAATAVVAAGATAFLLRGAFNKRVLPSPAAAGTDPARTLRLLLLSAATYLVWILFFQNVIHQTRHVLPLVPPLLMLLAAGLTPGNGSVTSAATNAAASVKMTSPAARVAMRSAAALFLGAYAFVGLALAVQHMKPAAIAQAKDYVESFADTNTVIVTAPWVEKCLSAQGVRARFLSVETPEELAALPARVRDLPTGTPLATVGDYRDILAEDVIRRRVATHRTFHHNPYVNRLGSRIEVLRYGALEAVP